ncbi:3-methyl-2-oxobutanoate hydroxymethyltransferase [Ruficoccus amylovorans]|uniref:3-methyl-2-oxobutanoate hydroxymethyltransferase n=1 Tax=Ruficoccus amylovorans TaxID=1804625 RepID=A0A842H9K0_9BACT|nr:3-methyl-2-oxobutanoate hydroxymethyltransferase [Ruficoccus amylovorans]MBC2592990.1 3-methyl-2-oxobutanoate hydroxymethyltransferase [Ruficoccus amylovorans]
MGKVSTRHIRQLKGKRPVVCVTAYDSIIAGLASEAGIDLILVGDSMGTTHLGFDTTVPVTVPMMLQATASVVRAKPDALVVADIPFAIIRRSPDFVLETCARFMQEAGADAVKIEGGEDVAPTIALLTASGIPVLGHIGLLPQQVYQLGGYRKFGKTEAEKEQLIRDAQALEKAGAFAMVGEMIAPEAAAAVSAATGVPLIGIGCGVDCDGQVLVYTDLLGLTPGYVPAFAKQYANLRETVRNAFSTYAEEVRERKFPS